MPESEWPLVPLPSFSRGASRASDGASDDLPQLFAAAALGLVVEAQRRSLERAVRVAARFAWPLGIVARPMMAVALRSAAVARRRLDLDGWAARGLAEQRRGLEAVGQAVRALVAATVAAVLDEVDIDEVAARIDIDRIIARIDVDAIAARIDIDRIVDRVDVDAVVARIDLPALAEQVIDEVDIGELIRESSSTMASETVDALRVQGMRVDGMLNRIVDRLLLRQGQRQTGPLPDPSQP